MAGRALVLAVLMPVIWLCGCARVQEPIAAPPEPVPEAAAPGGAEPEARSSTVLRFAWVSRDGELVLVDPETGETSVALSGMDSMGDWPDWDEAGSVVAFVAADGKLKLADLSRGTLQAIGRAPAGLPGSVAVSPDGTKVAWAGEDTLLVWVDGQAIEVGGLVRPTTSAWSPDSTQIAVGAMGEDESVDGGLWLVDEALVATRIVPAADDWGATQDIRWSPDARWLAWARGAGDGWTGDIARSDGGDLRRDAIGAGPIAWFPDSSALLVSTHIEAGAFATGIYHLAEGSLSPIGPDFWDSRAALSPDGSRVIAWGHNWAALVVDTATGEETTWPEDLPVAHATWAPDGRLGVIVDSGDNGAAVWVGNASGEGAVICPAGVETQWTARWISLPADAAALNGPVGE